MFTNAVDQAITDITVAADDTAALEIVKRLPSVTLAAVADQLYVETDGHSLPYIRKAIVTEARS